MLFPAPNQKDVEIAVLLVEEMLPLFGVPESLLLEQRVNIPAHVMYDVCELLGITKLSTITYHPQSNGMVE